MICTIVDIILLIFKAVGKGFFLVHTDGQPLCSKVSIIKLLVGLNIVLCLLSSLLYVLGVLWTSSGCCGDVVRSLSDKKYFVLVFEHFWFDIMLVAYVSDAKILNTNFTMGPLTVADRREVGVKSHAKLWMVPICNKNGMDCQFY